MSPSLWQSPVCRTIAEMTTSTDESSTAHDCIIPKDGWYVFLSRNERIVIHHPADNDNDNDMENDDSTLVLVVKPPSSCNPQEQTEKSKSTWKIDLFGNGLLWNNLHFGKLIYLSQGCEVAVVSRTEGKIRSASVAIPCCKLQWKLQFWGSNLPSMHSRTSRHNGDGEARSVSSPAVGSLWSDETKKTFVCKHCHKMFASVQSVQFHIEHKHHISPMMKERNRLFTVKCSDSVAGSDAVEQDDCARETDDSDHTDGWHQGPLEVVYTDPFLVVINKPQNMTVQGSKAEKTLMKSDLLLPLACTPLERRQHLGTSDSVFKKPRIVHRLDAATGGLLVLAKTRQTETSLKLAFANRQCHKRYRAIVIGKLIIDSEITNPNEKGCINEPISNKPSISYYQPVRHVRSVHHSGWLTVVDLWPESGRRHQLRKHMKHLGHPILGDRRYSGKKELPLKDVPPTQRRLCLWAVEIILPHPSTGEPTTISIPDPEWLDFVVKHEESEWNARQQTNETEN